MKKAPRRSSSVKMIHVRLDEQTHRLMKVQAAKRGITIQKFVEQTIRKRVLLSEAPVADND